MSPIVPQRMRGLVRPWDSPAQRWRRGASRNFTNVTRSANWPMAPSARLYWWDWRPNFGDAINPWLLQQAGINVHHAMPTKANLVAIGSILEHLPADYAGMIWGSGLVEGVPKVFEHAQIFALRGRLTMQALGISDVPLGDPGLLISDYWRPIIPSGERGGTAVVRHFLHSSDPLPIYVSPDSMRAIDVSKGPEIVFDRIARAQAVLTSSLHGLITADALGIPAAWFRENEKSLVTKFKFHDYESVVTPGWSREIDPWTLDTRGENQGFHRPDMDAVRQSQVELRESLQEIRLALPRANPIAFMLYPVK